MFNISYKDHKFFQGAFDVPIEKKDYTAMSSEELYAEIKKLPEAKELVLPNSWYEKFDLPPKECRNMKEFLAESPWKKRSGHMYVGNVETIPAKPGGNRPTIETTPTVAEVLIQNSYSDATDQSAVSNPSETQQS
jgi:hypothetical protein